jgi:hypothetical protein
LAEFNSLIGAKYTPERRVEQVEKAEIRSQNSELRTQNSELRTQKSELRSQDCLVSLFEIEGIRRFFYETGGLTRPDRLISDF